MKAQVDVAIYCACGKATFFQFEPAEVADSDVKTWEPCCSRKKTATIKRVTIIEHVIR